MLGDYSGQSFGGRPVMSRAAAGFMYAVWGMKACSGSLSDAETGWHR